MNVSQRDPSEMSIEALREEFAEVDEEIDFWEPYETQSEIWDRRERLWNALEEHADVEQPECPRCDACKWGQSPGDPAECLSCGLVAPGDLETEIHEAWEAIVGNDEDSDDDGGEQ